MRHVRVLLFCLGKGKLHLLQLPGVQPGLESCTHLVHNVMNSKDPPCQSVPYSEV